MRLNTKQDCFLIAAALYWQVAVPVLAQNPASAKVESPSIKIGDSWTYNKIDGLKNLKEFTSVSVVTAVSDAEFRTEQKRTDTGEITTLTRNRDLNRLVTESTVGKDVAEPYFPSYSFPLEIGKGWEKEVTFTRSL